jgi:hypothetical protein
LLFIQPQTSPTSRHNLTSKSARLSTTYFTTLAPTASYPFYHTLFTKNHRGNVDFASSPIHGHGVFATEDIKPGVKIIRERALWVIDKITLVRGSFPTSLHDFTEMQDIMVNSFKRSNAFEEGSAEREQHEGMILGLWWLRRG